MDNKLSGDYESLRSRARSARERAAIFGGLALVCAGAADVRHINFFFLGAAYEAYLSIRSALESVHLSSEMTAAAPPTQHTCDESRVETNPAAN
jgi:hypothetical protein